VAVASPAKWLEEKSILENQQRVKFQLECLNNGACCLPKEKEWKPLARALEMSEALGAAPVCPVEGLALTMALCCA
jgi:hypothetical protein